MDALTLLRLQVEWGADEALEDAPIDRLRAAAPTTTAPPAPRPRLAPAPRDPAAPVPATPAPALQAATAPTPAATGTPVEQALAAAGRADSLEALRAAITAFQGCELRRLALNPVLPAGDPASPLLLIGDPPDAEDDRTGRPFAGPEGQLLDRLLESAGLTRARLLLVPLLPWRPAGGRPATAAEVAVCLPFLYRLIVLLRPACLVLCGGQAVRAVLGSRPRPAGSFRRADCVIPGLDQPIEALVLPFPMTVLRQGNARREAWAALRRMRRVFDATR